jgi:hypothetical protein
MPAILDLVGAEPLILPNLFRLPPCFVLAVSFGPKTGHARVFISIAA